jgi:hypothetical protein
MKTKRLFSFSRIRVFLIVLAVAALRLAPSDAGGNAHEGAKVKNGTAFDSLDAGASATAAEILTVDPGRVTFRVSSRGRWVGLWPAWDPGRSAISGGGFAVFARNENGSFVELVNTTNGHLVSRSSFGGDRTIHEGIQGGRRYPLDGRDDDVDGREDEDCLDSTDNDGDGLVDEDFAAVGDQMIALRYGTRTGDSTAAIEFHQECSAWSLPHIDGMVAMKLVVRNLGARPLNGLRVGVIIRKPAGFEVSTRRLDPTETRDNDRMTARAILMSEKGRTPVVAVFFAETSGMSTSWVTGAAAGDRHLADLVQAAARTPEMPATPSDGVPSKVGNPQPARGGDVLSDDRMAYGVSPDLGNVGPGEERVLYAALSVVPSLDRVDRAIDGMYRTVVGDGVHRMIPPPVSVTRRTVWGTYAAGSAVGDPVGATIILENARAQGVSADNISRLEGVETSEATITETVAGNIEISLPNSLNSNAVGKRAGDRIELQGRLRNGEVFDALLKPTGVNLKARPIAAENTEPYWNSPGKLDDAFLVGSPNPFRESTTIYYQVPSGVSDEDGSVLDLVNPARTSVKVYNVTGRLVSVLVDDLLSPGSYQTPWNGVDNSGATVASGVYYVKLQIGSRHVTKRLIQVK